ncbi:MAG: diguanylate cyclase [Proteobacteria bacterium]|nr:diguanylate cyclase [Pseudomonadota bacterium]
MIKDTYTEIERVSASDRNRLARVRDKKTGRFFLMKHLGWGTPGAADKARFFKEYEALKSLDHEGILKVIDLVAEESGVFLIHEDTQGEPLSRMIQHAQVNVETFLRIAIHLAATLGFLHQNGLFHGGIKPNNILVQPRGSKVKLTDFGVNTLITGKKTDRYQDEGILLSLLYRSPEQTGRMNRSVDYRTDLYSLGVTLFELATGVVPFRSRDPLELIYCHLAIVPYTPCLIRPELPEPVGAVIMKLLEKAPEERYQNAHGLKADLEICLAKWIETGQVDDFELGQKDIADSFIIPQRLYGRANELRLLLDNFDRACLGEKRTIFVTGDAGVGKSALIHEIHKPIVAKRGYFLFGKYEPYKKDSPYSAIFQALIGLISQILREEDNEILAWKEKLLTTLGANCTLMNDIFPDLDHITGKQPEPVPAEPEEARNRFIHTLSLFVSLFATRQHPFVFFLDDLQWADFASLNFLKNLISNPDIRHVLFIFSYRDREVQEGHPVHEMIRDMEQKRSPAHEIRLTPLMEQDVVDLVSDFLKCSKKKAWSLGSQIFGKTAGNPFFINQFLKTLYDGGKIWLDPSRGFQWNDEDIKAMRVTENVVDLMAEKISKLPEQTQEILKICACIGNRFDLETLADVMTQSLDQVFSSLKSAIDQGYLKIVNNLFFYNHDRIHEAAYSLIHESERAYYHYRIGKILLARSAITPDYENQMMYITDQLNLARNLIKDPDEKQTLSNLNLASGLKAKQSAAYIPALHYLKTSADLLSPGDWRNNYLHTLSVYNEIAEVACVNQEYDVMTWASDTVIRNAQTGLDQVRVYESSIRACFHVQDFRKGLDKGITLLKQLGFPFPKNPGNMDVLLELIRVKWGLSRMTIPQVEKLPAMTDNRHLALARLMLMMVLPAAPVDAKLFAFLVLKLVRLTLAHGRNFSSAMAFCAFGGLMISMIGDRKTAIQCGDLAIRLNELPEGQMMKHKTHLVYNLYIRHWKENLPACKSAIEATYALCRESGDLLFTGISLAYGDFISLIMAPHYGEFMAWVLGRTKITEKTNHLFMIQLHKMILQFVFNFNEDRDNPQLFNGPHFNEQQVIRDWKEKNNFSGLFYFYTLKIIALYQVGRYDEIAEYTRKAHQIIPMAKPIFVSVFFSYFDMLTCLALCHGLLGREKKRLLRYVDKRMKQLRAYADLEPGKHQPWFYLIKAERAWVCGRDTDAMTYYGQAIPSFGTLPSVYLQAMACERAACFYLDRNQPILARAFAIETSRLYRTSDLKALSRRLKSGPLGQFLKDWWPDPGSSADESRFIGKEENLDLSTVMKTAQALSGEIVLEKLLSTIMKISIENAGARKGFLILVREQGLFIEAWRSLDRKDAGVLASLPVEESDDLSVSVVNYVARTGNVVVLSHASKEGDFVTDPYILKNKVKSLMAAPMISAGKLKGIIYLENNLASHMFTTDRLNMLDLLFSQATISLENAQLFEEVRNAESRMRKFNVELEKRVEERTAELQAAYEKIKVMAHTDPLTGLPNRRYMMDKIRHELARTRRTSSPFALVLGDIDHFKLFNDNYGHDCGDALLMELSRLLSGMLREQDQMARWGGEEFLFLFPDTAGKGALNVAEKIRNQIEKWNFSFNGQDLSITMTMGVSMFDDPKKEIDHYLKKADQALYEGKKHGRNRVVLAE